MKGREGGGFFFLALSFLGRNFFAAFATIYFKIPFRYLYDFDQQHFWFCWQNSFKWLLVFVLQLDYADGQILTWPFANKVGSLWNRGGTVLEILKQASLLIVIKSSGAKNELNN